MEFGVIITLLLALLAGILEFGRAWSAANVLNAAARDGARLASITVQSRRHSAVKARVQDAAAGYFPGNDLNVQITNGTGTQGVPTVTVRATGSLKTLFGTYLLGGKKISLSRSMTVRDETVRN